MSLSKLRDRLALRKRLNQIAAKRQTWTADADRAIVRRRLARLTIDRS